jgi:hypothetical protein
LLRSSCTSSNHLKLGLPIFLVTYILFYRLIFWFMNSLVSTVWGHSLTPNPRPEVPGCPSSSGSYPLTCPAWVTLPVATLLPA